MAVLGRQVSRPFLRGLFRQKKQPEQSRVNALRRSAVGYGMDAKLKRDGLTFDHLSPSEFEEFTYDLLGLLGFANLSWRKGSGRPGTSADQGRDIKADLHRHDFDKTEHFEKYFIQCKHFKEGVPPTKLEDALAWSFAERPSVLLFVISNFLSNPAKNWLEAYERNNHPPFRIKVWERKDLEGLLASNPSLIRKYGLGSIDPDLGLHPAHITYMRHPTRNKIEHLLTILDSIEPERRDAIFSMTYHSVIRPRYRNPFSPNETMKDLLMDPVDYPSFRTKCIALSKQLSEHFLVGAIVSDALRWIAHLADPLDVDRVVAVNQDLARHFEEDLRDATDPEEKSKIHKILEFTRNHLQTIPERQRENQGHYEFLCEKILPRLYLESLRSRNIWAHGDSART
jgi:hypothetical protein